MEQNGPESEYVIAAAAANTPAAPMITPTVRTLTFRPKYFIGKLLMLMRYAAARTSLRRPFYGHIKHDSFFPGNMYLGIHEP
jgi:hypothetical protein